MDNKSLFLIGYGGVTFLVLLLFLIIFPAIIKKVFKEDSWVVWKHIIFLLIIILTIGIGNYIYTYLLIDYLDWSWKVFFLFQLFTLIIGVIPITVTTLVDVNRKLKKNLALAGSINRDINMKSQEPKKINEKIKLTGKNKNEEITVIPNKIYFIRSEGNYVQVLYEDENELKYKMIRNTLFNIKSQVEKISSIIPCHRAYLVNTNKIAEARGNAQGFILKLQHARESVPVSRKYVPLIRKNLSN